jgi:hypothetical protein
VYRVAEVLFHRDLEPSLEDLLDQSGSTRRRLVGGLGFCVLGR